MKELRGPPSLESTNDIADIKRRPGDYIPPVLMSMAVAEFNNGDVADAEFWLHAGLLRSVLDVKLCSDLSMRDTPRVLLLQMPVALRRAALADPIEKAKVAREVAAWDETTPMSYDHRWTALHGIQATMSAMEPEHALTVLTVPQSQWAEAAKNNRTEYLTQMSNGSAPKPTR